MRSTQAVENLDMSGAQSEVKVGGRLRKIGLTQLLVVGAWRVLMESKYREDWIGRMSTSRK